MKLNSKENKNSTKKAKYRQAEVFASFIANKKINVLDIGCGEGEYVHWYGLNNCRALGIDIKKRFIETARNISFDVSELNVQFSVDDCSRVPDVCKNEKYDLILFVGSRVIDTALFDINKIVKLLSEYQDLLTVNGKIIIFELTDFSGRIEAKAGWKMKTQEEISFIISVFQHSGAKLYYMKGLSRLPFLYKYDFSRNFFSFFWKFISPKYLNYTIVIPGRSNHKLPYLTKPNQ